MLHFSFSTVLMALLTSNIIAILIAIPLLKKDLIPYIGYKFLFCSVVLALFRLILPFEFPFTNNILLPQSLARVTSFLQKPWIHVIGIRISYWNIFEFVWIVGIIITLFFSIRNYRRAQNYITRKGIDKTENPKYKPILDDICRRHHQSNRFRVMELPGLTVPIIWGTKEPLIILPNAIDIPFDKLQYILYHETLHYFRHDPFVKNAIHFLAIIYWWNPACRLLHKHSNLLLEMYVDQAVTNENPDVVQEYTECLLFMKKQALHLSSNAAESLEKAACLLIQRRNSEIQKRIIMLIKKPSRFLKAGANILFAILIIFILVWSHLYILETAYYPPPAEGEITFFPLPENTYFIIDEFSEYEVYINGVYIETIASFEFYPEGIKIYSREGVLINQT